mmetsp:Transcript_117197/g.227856  ORF Transcript_117197/g.227856 Transcript_117197/m.227856 type:complete len:372 (-) Transcript_117197:875-1990(-)
MADIDQKKAQLKAKFKSMDTNGDGQLDFNEFLGLMSKLDTDTATKLFKKVDKTGDGVIDFEEFVDYIYDTGKSKARTTDTRHARLAFLGAVDSISEEDAELWGKCEVVFQAYSGGDEKFEGRDLRKLCVDCVLFDRKFKQNDLDVIFTGAKARGQNTINFEKFKDCVRGIAKKKNCSTTAVQAAIAEREETGVQINATQADAVRFHDDKSTYTGMHARGGRHGDDVSGATTRSERLRASGRLDHSEQEELPWGPTQEAFLVFCKGDEYLDSREFTQMCDDCGLYNRKFTRADADVTFNKVKNKGERKIDFEQFKDACIAVAGKRGSSVADVQKKVHEGQPTKRGVTEADFVRFHDDKTTYTGMHVEVHNAA